MGIGEYFLSVISASVITALISMLFGEDKANLSKSLNTACSLFLLCVIVSPISSMIARAKEGISTDNIGFQTDKNVVSVELALYTSLGEISAEAIEESLHARICESAGMDEGDLDVSAEVRVSDGEVFLKRVVIHLYGSAKWSDPRTLREIIGEMTDAECLIINGD